MQTDHRQATVVGGGQQEAAAGAPREMMVLGLDWWWVGRRRDGVGLGISSIIKGFHLVREVESSMISEEATFVLSRSSCAVLGQGAQGGWDADGVRRPHLQPKDPTPPTPPPGSCQVTTPCQAREGVPASLEPG